MSALAYVFTVGYARRLGAASVRVLGEGGRQRGPLAGGAVSGRARGAGRGRRGEVLARRRQRLFTRPPG